MTRVEVFADYLSSKDNSKLTQLLCNACTRTIAEYENANAQFTPPARQDKTVPSVLSGVPVWIGRLLWTCSDFKFSVGDSLELSGIQFTLPKRTRHRQDSFVVSGVAVWISFKRQAYLQSCSGQTAGHFSAANLRTQCGECLLLVHAGVANAAATDALCVQRVRAIVTSSASSNCASNSMSNNCLVSTSIFYVNCEQYSVRLQYYFTG